ncbi:MAG TPA: UDP-N-acetylmuramoyl-tripeptide--D-alanyl-D-alanine ligase, partial [Acidobacteriota bacterium]
QLKEKEFESYGIDSRTIVKGALFFALKGEHTNGHLFLQDAFARGAAGAIVSQDVDVSQFPGTLVRAADSLAALHALGAFVRGRSRTRFIGITGSSGKTSTKEFTATLLAQKYKIFKSEGNLNSITGLPLSLLAMQPADYAVFEIAMNQPGEIARLASVLKPHLGVLLNVNPVHLGQFTSIDDIAVEKCSLVTGMATDATVLLNADDARIAPRIPPQYQNRVSFGISEKADLRITDIFQQGVRGTRAAFRWKDDHIPFDTNLCGVSNLYNIAAAVSIGLTLGLEWRQILNGISKLQPYEHRGVLLSFDGIHVYDDCYNSNPKALEISLEIMRQSRGYKRKIAVVGDMLELGKHENDFHRQAGEQVASAGIDVLVATGKLSQQMIETAQKGNVREIHSAMN